MLDMNLTQKDKQISAAESQIADLTERLRTSLQMDTIAKNQDLMAFKGNISEALKLDYSDFMKNKDSQYDQDLFEAYRATLSRIFKLLKRHGIACQ
jgi:hypothetical protein